MKVDKVESFPDEPETDTYICEDDEGNWFVYVGEDTFSRLDPGPQRDHWMKKLSENKVTIAPLGGFIELNVATGETTLKHSDRWDVTDFGVDEQKAVEK